ncbi:NPCBM/NEW2 domain-containing protein [Streptomyces poriticola]|uniref:NPCBM/NEW2 domain-containing protein n=1 Tax=Streptomyces poriticola TaxID=3120506 RepID=UPI002FCE080D
MVAGGGTYAAVHYLDAGRTGTAASQDGPPPATPTPAPETTGAPDTGATATPTPTSSPSGSAEEAGADPASPSESGAGADTGELPLTSLEAVEMTNMEQGSATVDTEPHEDALLAEAGFCFVSSVEYNLAREWATLRFVAGITDVSADGIPRKVTVHGDGELLTSKTLNFGSAMPVSVDVSGVLRLRLEVTNVDSDGCSSDVVTALAEPVLTK